MYKPLYNVFELVCISDPNNFFKENYTLDNFKQYKFKHLRCYAKSKVILPKSGKVVTWKTNQNKMEPKDFQYKIIKSNTNPNIYNIRMQNERKKIVVKNLAISKNRRKNQVVRIIYWNQIKLHYQLINTEILKKLKIGESVIDAIHNVEHFSTNNELNKFETEFKSNKKCQIYRKSNNEYEYALYYHDVCLAKKHLFHYDETIEEKIFNRNRLARASCSIYINPKTGRVYQVKNDTGKIILPNLEQEIQYTMNEKLEMVENVDFGNYFEEEDISNIKMLYRFQFVLTKFKSLEEIFQNFDLNPSRVAFDGHVTYFTPEASKAYRYMINVVNEKTYSNDFNYRVLKYLTYGFGIVMSELDLDKVKLMTQGDNKKFKINSMEFEVDEIKGNRITLKHDAYVQKQIKQINDEKKVEKVLYKTNPICSLVSLLRYVKIHQIGYIFTDQVINLDQALNMKFAETTEKIKFLDQLNVKIPNYDFYGNLRSGVKIIDVVKQLPLFTIAPPS
jgi:hypothetical protein